MEKNENRPQKPVTDKKPKLFGAKRVVDNEGVTVCLWKKDKLYDLKFVPFGECIRVKKTDETDYGDKYVRKSNCIYKSGQKVGTIRRDWFKLTVALLLALLAVSVVALVLLTHEEKKPLTEEIVVVDTSGEWSADGKIKIFGDGTIKPGDKGSYAFMVTNPHAVRLRCTVEFKPSYGDADFLPPIRYKVVSEGRTLETNEIDGGFGIKDVVVGENGSKTFYLEWEWVFDGGTDYEDTIAGFRGGEYSLAIRVTAEETN